MGLRHSGRDGHENKVPALIGSSARGEEKVSDAAAARQTGEGDPRWARAMFETRSRPTEGGSEIWHGPQREFIARVHAKLLERLSAGETIQAQAEEPAAKDDPLEYSR